MLSESARMTTAEEARYRIDYPNSKPRATKVIALDPPSEAVVKRLAQGKWQQASFFTSLKFDGAPRSGEDWSMKAWLSDLAGRTKDLIDEVADRRPRGDGGERRHQAEDRRRDRGSLRRAQGDDHGADHRQRDSTPTKSCRGRSRRCALMPAMLVIASNDDYIEEMLVALRA